MNVIPFKKNSPSNGDTNIEVSISICWKFSTQTSPENIIKGDIFKLTWESRHSCALPVHKKLEILLCFTSSYKIREVRHLSDIGWSTWFRLWWLMYKRHFNSLYHSYRSLSEPCVVAVPAAVSAVSTELYVVQMCLQDSTAA